MARTPLDYLGKHGPLFCSQLFDSVITVILFFFFSFFYTGCLEKRHLIFFVALLRNKRDTFVIMGAHVLKTCANQITISYHICAHFTL